MTKAAVLIDGGFFLKRLPSVRKDVNVKDADDVSKSIMQLIRGHLEQLNKTCCVPHYVSLLYRGFYYDAPPFEDRLHTPVQKRSVNHAKSIQAQFRRRLFESLERQPNLAVRLGEIRKYPNQSWTMKPNIQKDLLSGRIKVKDLTDDHFNLALRQKGVDMRIGIDIAEITLKRHANTIILISGDTDFIPAAKFARREGMTFILDSLRQDVSPNLSRHIDGLRCGFHNSQLRGSN